MINGISAKNPNFVTKRSRVESYAGKTIAANQTPENLASAGFYNGLNVCCNRCNLEFVLFQYIPKLRHQEGVFEG